MVKRTKIKPILTIDLRIRFQSRIYQIRLGQLMRWIVPILLVASRIISHVQDSNQ